MDQIIPCPRCGGKGSIPNAQFVGATMRKLREKAKLSLREMARQMGVTAPYISDLELGHRSWPPERVEQFRRICSLIHNRKES